MTRGLRARLGMLALVLLLAGCAAQQAYREGQELLAQGRVPESLARLEEASRIEPGSAQYRIALLQTRELWVQKQLELATLLQRQGELGGAEQIYKQVLAMQGGSDRALAGLRAIDLQRRAQEWLRQARTSLDKKDMDAARSKLNAVLLEDPSNEVARALLQKMDEASAANVPKAVLAAAYRKPITIEFKDAPLRNIFDVISRSSGLNFLLDKDVRGDQKTSIFLKSSTIEAAVNLTLLTNQLEQKVLDANTVLIYPNTPAKQKEYQQLTVKSFYLANAEAKTVAATLKTLLKARDVVVDDKLNLLILRDTPEAIRLADKLVALHDVPESEVMLEVEVLEVKRARLLELGIRWPDQLKLTPLAGAAGGVLTLSELRDLNSSRLAAGVGPVSINARKVDVDANILANPRIRARNREKAKILIGERVPNITATSTSTGFVAESVTYVDVGLKLDVEPTIYLDGEVAIKVALEVSNIINQVQTKSGSIAYQIGTRTAQTVLRLKDGENQVLAGLINDEDRRTASKVPVLGDIPVAGRLFGSHLDDGSKTEIVLSITPRILRTVRRPDASVLEFDSGTENSLGARLTAPPAPPVVAPAIAPGAPGRPPPSAPAATDAARANAPQVVAPPVSGAGAAPPGAGAPILRWEGPGQLRVGDSFALQLLMQSDQPVVSLPLAVTFDPRMLEATNVQEGDFLRQGGAATTFTSRVEPGGQLLMTGTRSGETGASALGTVATITFRVASAVSPETAVRLLAVAPVGLGGRSVPAPLPPPHTIRVTGN